MDIERFNTAWLDAWSRKDVPRLLEFYAADTVYIDNQVPAGIEGHDALKQYLEGLFGATPSMTYEPDAVWPIEGGYCGRWICTIDTPDGPTYMRGFDLVLMAHGKIARNEVYTHALKGKP